MKTCTVQVRYAGNGYTARAGRGKKAKTASATSDPATAAQRAAAKFFHLDSCNIQTAADIIVTGRFTHNEGGTYTATLPDLPAEGGA